MRKGFITDDDNKKYHKDRYHCHYTGKYRGPTCSIYNLRYKTSKEIPTVFDNGSTYDYNFIIKELAKESDGQFESLRIRKSLQNTISLENKKKCVTFSVPVKKELDNGKRIT